MWSRLLALALLLLPAPSLAGVKEKIAALAPSGLVLVVDAGGHELVAQNADQPFVPASVTKIVTAWLAMEVLGGDYRFETRFYLDDHRVLYVRGGGDPFLISEELSILATELVAAVGKQPITGIMLDASYYPQDLRIPGIEDDNLSYDALNSALAVNFNTVFAVRSGDKVRSAEPQTPITPVAISEFQARGPNGSGRISLSQDPAVSLQYAGELIAAFINRAGGSVAGKISAGHARALLAVADPDALAKRIVAEGLTVRDIERLGENSGKTARPRKGAAPVDADTKALQEKLALALGTKVTIRHGGETGEIRIAFRDFDQLDDFCRRLCQSATD